jgi:hypothetical protein
MGTNINKYSNAQIGPREGHKMDEDYQWLLGKRGHGDPAEGGGELYVPLNTWQLIALCDKFQCNEGYVKLCYCGYAWCMEF